MRSLLAAALLLTACGGDDEVLPPDAQVPPDAPEAPDAADPADAGPDGMTPDATPCVNHGGQVREDVSGMPFPTLPPVADVVVTALVDGVEIAQTTTIADGTFGICVPPDTSVVLVFEKAGFNNQAFLRVTTGSLYLEVRFFSEATATPLWEGVGGTYPSTTDGFVTVIALDSALTATVAGMSASLSPASGGGPFYFDDTFMYDSALTETSSLGLVIFANVDPGQVDLVIDHATLGCAHELGGFVSPTPGALRIPVIAGVETSVNLKCE